MIYAQGDTSNIQIQLTQKSAAPLCFLMRLICAFGRRFASPERTRGWRSEE